ncbi:VWA domain-containing protein [bacterium]|nr:VWA domain-containing protein [bacterium]
MKSNSKLIPIVIGSIVAAVVIIVIAVTASISPTSSNEEGIRGRTLEELLERIDYDTATPVKASVNMTDTSLYDELPAIDKYPLVVTGQGDIDIEIFTSGEKAGSNNDSWLIDCAREFNDDGYTTPYGKTISISVRSVSSGLAADYIMSNRYLPDLYTPSNELFGQYAIANGGNLELYNSRLVGNTAGILVRKGSGYTDIDAVVKDVMSGKLNIGYTNPQTSATGLNLLVEILKSNGGVNDDNAISAFTQFNNNIPFVAYTTQQMVDSTSNGTLDGMVTEYQAYINDKNLQASYDFIAFGMRHDNPLYVVNKSAKSDDELYSIEVVNDYLMNEECQSIATRYGFNANDDYADSYTTGGAEITQALKLYKTEKDAGKDIVAVFVADCSGSMDGSPIHELKESLSNGMQYINANNYVGLISYSTDVTLEVPIAPFDLNQKAYFQGAINNFVASGGTASYEALCVAMKMIEEAKVDHPNAKCMIFLLTDGYANGHLKINDIERAVVDTKIPIYTIGYTSNADMDSLKTLSNINEAASISADSDDIIYKIKSLFNAQL